jgi:hypothetical protein
MELKPDKKVKSPIYSDDCPKCKSSKTFPIMNVVGSPRMCTICNYYFNPTITGYNTVIVSDPSCPYMFSR